MIEQPIFGLNNARSAAYACIPAASYLRGDILVLRHVAPWVETGALIPTRTYLRSSLFDGAIFLGNAADPVANPTNDVPDTPNSVRALQAHAYFVGPSGRSCNGAAIPSLFRVSLADNGQPVVNELLPGIEHFQVQYGVNDQYLNANPADIALTDWPDVITVRIWLLVRSECTESGYTDGTTYNMGDITYTPTDTANNGHRRQLYSSVVMIRN